MKTIEDKAMKCKKCGGKHIIKAGLDKNNRQRYKCRDCHSRWVINPKKGGRPQKSHPNVQCVNCGSSHLVKNGKNRIGNQMWKCKNCGTRGTFSNNFQE